MQVWSEGEGGSEDLIGSSNVSAAKVSLSHTHKQTHTLFLSLSLSLSLSHTHTHTHKRTLCLSLSFSFSLTHTLSLSLSLARSRPPSHSFSPSEPLQAFRQYSLSVASGFRKIPRLSCFCNRRCNGHCNRRCNRRCLGLDENCYGRTSLITNCPPPFMPD